MWRLWFMLLVLLASVSPAHADYWVDVHYKIEIQGVSQPPYQTLSTFPGADCRLLYNTTGGDTLNQGGVSGIIIGGSSATSYGRGWYYGAIPDSFIPDVLDSADWWFYGNTAGTAALQADTLYWALVNPDSTVGAGRGAQTTGNQSWGTNPEYMLGITWAQFNREAEATNHPWGVAGADSTLRAIRQTGSTFALASADSVGRKLVYLTPAEIFASGAPSFCRDRTPWYWLGAYVSHSASETAWDFTDAFRWLYYDAPRLGKANNGWLIRDGREGENGRIVPGTK